MTCPHCGGALLIVAGRRWQFEEDENGAAGADDLAGASTGLGRWFKGCAAATGAG